MAAFGIKVEQLAPGIVRAAVSGELDLQKAYTFDLELKALEELGPATIVLDLCGTTFVDSAGLARIVAAQRRARKAQRRLLVVCGDAPVKRLFAITALEHELEVVREFDPAAV